jgi:hypothetical protein
MRVSVKMSVRVSGFLLACLLVAAPGLAKDKAILPVYILTAHTVVVLIDPEAGIDIQDPRANQVAQKDVETALAKWGRFEVLNGAQKADLVVVIRRGHKRMTDVTMNDPTQNSRVGVTPTDSSIGAGGQIGRAPVVGGYPDSPSARAAQAQAQNQAQNQTGTPQAEIGFTDDSLVVYSGASEHPTDSVPGWRYVGQEGLRSHSVPAVDDFRKAVAAAEKAAAAKKP